jgi:hypothetical protein
VEVIWLDFQEALMIVAGQALAWLAAFFLAGAFLLSAWHVAGAVLRRYTS